MGNPIDAVAVVLASGSGQRFGSKIIPKHLTPLLGAPVMVWTLRTALHSGLFSAITVVTREQDVDDAQRIIKEYFPDSDPVIRVAEGANERMGSFINGFNDLKSNGSVDDETIVALMDANRPFASVEQLHGLLEAAHDSGCACPARQVVNGIARIESGCIAEVPVKSEYVEFVTPEFMRVKDFNLALDKHGSSIACLVEYALALGIRPVIIDAKSLNTKLTFPEDATFLEGLARKHEIPIPELE